MTWNIRHTEPTYGICSQCKQHECGIVDGQHIWIQSDTMLDRDGDRMVIGYRCVKQWADNLGFTKGDEAIKEVTRPPTDEEIGAWVRENLFITSSNGMSARPEHGMLPIHVGVNTNVPVDSNSGANTDASVQQSPSDSGTPQVRKAANRARRANNAAVRKSR